MSTAVVITCLHCQATMHRSWRACVVCQTPAPVGVVPVAVPLPRPTPLLFPERLSGLVAVTTHGRYTQPPKRDVENLGPVLPACPVCATMQYWHNHVTDVWECWGCVPPVLRATTEGVAA